MAVAGMLAGKVALVTGSTSGIGLAMARALASAGAHVGLHGLGERSAIAKLQDELSRTHGVKVMYSDADLRQPHLIRDMVGSVAAELGRLDVLVNNAGRERV